MITPTLSLHFAILLSLHLFNVYITCIIWTIVVNSAKIGVKGVNYCSKTIDLMEKD